MSSRCSLLAVFHCILQLFLFFSSCLFLLLLSCDFFLFSSRYFVYKMRNTAGWLCRFLSALFGSQTQQLNAMLLCEVFWPVSHCLVPCFLLFCPPIVFFFLWHSSSLSLYAPIRSSFLLASTLTHLTSSLLRGFPPSFSSVLFLYFSFLPFFFLTLFLLLFFLFFFSSSSFSFSLLSPFHLHMLNAFSE